MTEVKSRGFPGTKLVKMNSNLVWLHLVKIYSASVNPRSLELTVLEVMLRTQLYPIAKEMISLRFNRVLMRLSDKISMPSVIFDPNRYGHLQRLTLGMLCECQMTLKLVTRILPLSPAFPLVSSIESNLSISISPGRIFIWLKYS